MVDGRGERLGEGKLVGGKGEVGEKRSLEKGSWLVGGKGEMLGGRLVDRGSSKYLTDILVPNSVL